MKRPPGLWPRGDKVTKKAPKGEKMKRTSGILFVLVLVVNLGLVVAAPVVADANIIHVPDDYDTIQEAIDAASDYDTIMVAAGLYEEAVVIDKSLTLEGAQAGVDARTRSGAETIIEPDNEEIGISILTAASRIVVIDGLTVQNGAHAIATPEFGLMAANITVKNVAVLHPGDFGISLTFTINANVEHCYVEDAKVAINAGAVLPAPPTVAIFRDNEVVNSEFGITGYLGDSLIEGNLIRDFANGGVGISAQFLNTEIKNNTVSGYVDGAGLSFEKSHHDRPVSDNVTVRGNNFTGSLHGIFVWPDQAEVKGITVNFNNIADNSWSGVRNEVGETLDATRNWWGDASGPGHWESNPDGMGDVVRGNVDFEPWLGAPLVSVKTKPVTETDGTVDAKGEADTEVAANGTAKVTVAQYADNPGDAPICFASLDKYIDVYSPDTTGVSELEIRLYYVDAEVAAANVSEESLRLFSWNGTAWVQCSDSGVNPSSANGYSGYVWAEIRGDTAPTLAQLTGTPFGGYGPRFLEFSIATTELPAGGEGITYEARLEACSGAEPYTWAITNGALPDGLELDASTGNISGTATRAGAFDFTVTVTDDDRVTATADFSVTITSRWPCFIATAAYGADTAQQIGILREFRDTVLLPDSLGAKLLALYYEMSPPIANFVSQHEVLRTGVRVCFVDPVVAILDWSRDSWSTGNIQQ
jgi:hypothetical protein